MKTLLKTSILLIVMVMIGCATSDSKKVDNFLDDYEKVVKKNGKPKLLMVFFLKMTQMK